MLLNRERALGFMAEYGIDALLGTTPVNLAYLSNFNAWTHWFYRLYTRENYWMQSYALLPRDQEPALLPSTETLAYLAGSAPSWIEDIYPFGLVAKGEEPPAHYPAHLHRMHRFSKVAAEKGLRSGGQAIVRALQDRGLTQGVIGVDAAGVHPDQLAYARRELPNAQFKEAGELFRVIRMVKTQEEIDLLREAAEINQKGLDAVVKAAAAGATELDLARAHRSVVSLHGGVPVFGNALIGPWAVISGEPGTRALQPGESFWCDAGCTYKYYNADGNVCGVLGEPTARHRELFDAQMDGVTSAMAKARPGAKASEMLEAYAEAEVEGGRVTRSVANGHGLGLEARDFPVMFRRFTMVKDEFVNMSQDVTLEPGMVFNLESVQREIGVGTVAVEVTVVTTSTGCEFLIPPPQLVAVPV